MSKLTATEYIETCKRLANGRAGAVKELRGGSFAEAMAKGYRWFPTISGERFKPSIDVGFTTRADAVQDARLIKAACRRAALQAQEGRDE